MHQVRPTLTTAAFPAMTKGTVLAKQRFAALHNRGRSRLRDRLARFCLRSQERNGDQHSDGRQRFHSEPQG